MNLNSRLSKLESMTAARGTRFCQCADRLRVIWPPDMLDKPSPGAIRCATCGGERITLKVVYCAN